MNVIDLFSGCGGLSLGFKQAGYDVMRAVELDPGIAATYRENHPETDMIVDDIRNIDNTGVFREGDADVIIGGPPCQGFSMAGARIRGGFIDDPRNYLFRHYFNVVRTVRPAVFVMENVKGITTMQGGRIFEEILGTFSDPELLGGRPYHVYPRLVRAVQFGVPQKRERMVLIGTLREVGDMDALWKETREDICREYPHYFDSVTVRDAIGNLGATSADGKIANPVARTEYQSRTIPRQGIRPLPPTGCAGWPAGRIIRCWRRPFGLYTAALTGGLVGRNRHPRSLPGLTLRRAGGLYIRRRTGRCRPGRRPVSRVFQTILFSVGQRLPSASRSETPCRPR